MSQVIDILDQALLTKVFEKGFNDLLLNRAFVDIEMTAASSNLFSGSVVLEDLYELLLDIDLSLLHL